MPGLDAINANDDVIKDPLIEQALREIYSTYGELASVKNKAKSLLKFGRNDAVSNAATGSTIMTLAGSEDHETFVSDNLIDTVSSSSGDDDQDLIIEGHTIDSNGDFTFVIQTATLDGQNKVVLSTPLARVTKMYNNDNSDLVGNIYAYQDGDITDGVPDTAAEVHCIIAAGKNQSEKCATTISKDDYWIITMFSATVLEKSALFADVEIQVRNKGKTFRAKDIIGVQAGNNEEQYSIPYMIVPPNSDVRLVGIASADNKSLAGSIHGFLASKL